MIKKLSLLCFLIIFINNCGYTPIYSNKDKNFVINKIDLVGDIEVNKILSNRLNIYKNNADAKRFFDIIINSKSTKTILTKDKKGNPTQFSQSVSVNLIITDIINNTEMQQNFTESSTYDSTDNKFDLKKYENNLIKNMSEKIYSDLILFIQTK
tara:strand:+ start:808 stop:1269 length:462 start_codon:yes stop_codon:yes gene_type:complete